MLFRIKSHYAIYYMMGKWLLCIYYVRYFVFLYTLHYFSLCFLSSDKLADWQTDKQQILCFTISFMQNKIAIAYQLSDWSCMFHQY